MVPAGATHSDHRGKKVSSPQTLAPPPQAAQAVPEISEDPKDAIKPGYPDTLDLDESPLMGCAQRARNSIVRVSATGYLPNRYLRLESDNAQEIGRAHV